MSDLLKRLETIENAIALGEEEVVALLAKKLPAPAAKLRGFLENKKYAAAAKWMGEFRKNNIFPAVYTEPEIAALQLELKSLENTLAELAAQKSECESAVAEFNAAYLAEVGAVLEKVLRAEWKKAQKRAGKNKTAAKAAKDARREYEEFSRQREQTPEPPDLSESEKAELKQLYRRAAFKCHPDRFPNQPEKAARAAEIFKELEDARRKLDIARVRDIWQKLQREDWTPGSAALANKTLLRRQIADLRKKTKTMRAEIAAWQKDETWLLIQSLSASKKPWADYFSEIREALSEKLRDG